MRTPQQILVKHLTNIIGETNGVSLKNTLDLLLTSNLQKHHDAFNLVKEFRELIDLFQINKISITQLLDHPV